MEYGVIACAALTVRAGTGVWTRVPGGTWAESANWQDGFVPLSSGTAAGAGMLRTLPRVSARP